MRGGHKVRSPEFKRDFRNELLKAASRGRTVTYGHLMRRFGFSRGRSLTGAIGGADRAERISGAPGFAAIVVRKDTGFPGGGYFCDDDLPASLRRPGSRSADPRLSVFEKDQVRRQQRTIWGHYGKHSDGRG